MSIAESAIRAFAAGVFARPDPFVVEAYSEPDCEPLQFTSAEGLAAYAGVRIEKPKGSAFVFVAYPDMGGHPMRRTIHLDPQHCPGQKVRYTWEGWGLISVRLYSDFWQSHVAANSIKRANARAATYPELGSPAAWNWKAVESHQRRLQRLLMKAIKART